MIPSEVAWPEHCRSVCEGVELFGLVVHTGNQGSPRVSFGFY